MSRPIEERLAETPCPRCGELTLALEVRPRVEARPLGTWSLAGAQDKTSAVEVEWPYAVCSAVGCGFARAATRA